jgi:uncharacterized protein
VPNHFLLDASALAKRYAPEAGTALVNHLFETHPQPKLLCLGIGILEVVSVLVRKRNAGSIDSGIFSQALLDFQSEIVNGNFPILAADPLISASVPLIESYSLNANDALVLRAALSHVAHVRATGDSVVVVTSDKRLIKASQSESIAAFNPETQTQAELDALIGP